MDDLSDILEPQDNPQLEPDPDPDPAAERQWWGPFTTFVSRRISSAREHYYVPSKPIRYRPSPNQDIVTIVVLRVPGDSALNLVITEAWQKGVQVNVWFGFPWINRTGIPGAGATVRQAEILWSPLTANNRGSEIEAYLDSVKAGAPMDGAEPVVRETASYTRKISLRRENGKLFGLWHLDFRRACQGAPRERYIHESSILELEDIGECASGHTITLCTHF